MFSNQAFDVTLTTLTNVMSEGLASLVAAVAPALMAIATRAVVEAMHNQFFFIIFTPQIVPGVSGNIITTGIMTAFHAHRYATTFFTRGISISDTSIYTRPLPLGGFSDYMNDHRTEITIRP